MGPESGTPIMGNRSVRFSYVKYDPNAAEKQEAFKRAFEEIENLSYGLEEGRAKSLFLTYLEIAYMWTGKAIRDEQIKRDNSSHAPERSNQ